MKNKTAQILRETAARLIKQAEELEAGVDRNECIHGEYTGRKFNGCKTCGNTVKVKCKFQKVGFVNSGKCNKKNCEHFKVYDIT